MVELIIVESIIGIFLFLHIVRPYVKAFWEADGFAFFPFAALLCCIAMIPAYGIRPECLPLFLFSLVYSLGQLPSVTAVFLRFKRYSVHNNTRVASFITAALLAFSLGAAFRFLPYDDPPSGDTQPVRFTINDSARGVDLFAGYYRGNGNDLVLLAPPVTIPLSMVEDICTALNKTGYNVLAFSRPYFDVAAVDENGETVEISLFAKLKRYMQAINGVENIKMAAEQVSVAAEREADIRFLLSAFKTDELLRETVAGCENVFLLGYGAGGAASIRLAGNSSFLISHPAIKAAAAIESVALCNFSVREDGGETNIRQNPVGALKELFQKPIPQLADISHPNIPVLVVAGDGAQRKNSYRRYMAVVQTMLESESPFLFASVNGIHAIDFSSIPRQYPVLAFLLQTEKEGTWPRESAIMETAGYIAAFFAHVKENPSLTYLQSNLTMPEAVFLETSRRK